MTRATIDIEFTKAYQISEIAEMVGEHPHDAFFSKASQDEGIIVIYFHKEKKPKRKKGSA